MNSEAGRLQQNRAEAQTRQFSAFPAVTRRGYSMSEVVIAISILGVLAAIVMPGMTGLLNGSKESIANEKLEMLNHGLNAYAFSNKEYTFPSNNGSTSDEMVVLLDLEYRNPDPDRALVGSPFVRPDYRPQSSSSASDFRIVWTGYRFKLLRPGDSGTGIKVEFDGSDMGTPFVYPPNYSSSGR